MASKRAILVACSIALTGMAFLPSAEAQIEPVECVHDLINNPFGAACTFGPNVAPPVGPDTTCNYTGGEVGGGFHTSPSPIDHYELCLHEDSAACGGDPGITVRENGNDYTQCFHPHPCGVDYSSSASNLKTHTCVDPTHPCGGLYVNVQTAMLALGSLPLCVLPPAPCGSTPPAIGWGIQVGTWCVLLPHVDVFGGCGGGITGNEYRVGWDSVYPGWLVSACL